MVNTARLLERRTYRHGFTLIEMLVAISMISLMLALAGMTFHLLLRTEKSVSQSFVVERSISRLAILFRDDVHRSITGKIVEGGQKNPHELDLDTSNANAIRYVVTPDGLVRIHIKNREIVSRDDFRLPECRVSFVAGEGVDSLLRALVIERPGPVIVKNQDDLRPLRPLRIESFLNRRPPSREPIIEPEAVSDTSSANAKEEK